jgi:hypothetical protein
VDRDAVRIRGRLTNRLGKLPPDLLADLRVAIADDDFKIDVHLQREPTQDELERLNGVVQSALAEFRRRLAER